MCRHVLPAFEYVHCMHLWCLWGSEESIESFAAGAIKGRESLCGAWESNPSFLPEQSVLLTTEPLLQAWV